MKPIVDALTGDVTIVERDPAEEALWEAGHRVFTPASERIQNLESDIIKVRQDPSKAASARGKLASLQAVVQSMSALVTAYDQARSPQAKEAIISTNFGDLLSAQASIAQALIDLTEATVKDEL